MEKSSHVIWGNILSRVSSFGHLKRVHIWESLDEESDRHGTGIARVMADSKMTTYSELALTVQCEGGED
eukprot:Em0002g1606a